MISEILSKPEIIVAVCALFVSVISIVIGALALRNQKIHNQKSVRPICSITYKNYLSEIVITVSNDGVGPMLVDALELIKNGKVYRRLKDLISPSFPSGGEYTYKWVNFIQQRTIPVGGHIEIFCFHKTEGQTDFESVRDKVRKALTEVTISIKYSDIYGKDFPRAERTLHNFTKSPKIE
ncbi:MAG: hypothetical protein GY712_05450 [Oceanicoccus sp.]|uniref:hypothetical protein n=1 Tax=Oceanicoccus sp. TaxID=2691044 RepID=UPI0026065DB0|nr:hypothetical protein [Oceanicoccus sp.]MCP3907446.1 hypothetical protein [Oceanicoccus sp.]